MAEKGLLNQMFTEEGQAKVDKEILELGIKDFKAQFQQTYRDAIRIKSSLSKELLQFARDAHDDIVSGDDSELDVDAIIQKEFELDQVNSEIEKLKVVYTKWFGEDFVE